LSISLQTSGVHHVTLRSTDLQRSRRFYVETLGFPVALEAPNLIVTLAGATAVVLRGPDAQTPTGDVFNPFRVGLDHVALACTDETELERVGSALSKAGVENKGVKLDPTLGENYIEFKDPDRIACQLYKG